MAGLATRDQAIMPAHCPRGLEYTTESVEAALEFDKAVTALAGYNTDPTPSLDKALEFDPNFILPHVFKVTYDIE